MIRVYLLLMFVLPLLELWDRWLARVTLELHDDGAIPLTWIGTAACWHRADYGRGPPRWFRVTWLRIPWARTWDYHINTDTYGWCYFLLLIFTGAKRSVQWNHVPLPEHYEPRPYWRGV